MTVLIGCGEQGDDGPSGAVDTSTTSVTAAHKDELFKQLLPLPPALRVVGTVDAEGPTGEQAYHIRYFVVAPVEGPGGADTAVSALRAHLDARGLSISEVEKADDWPLLRAPGWRDSELAWVSVGRLDRLLADSEPSAHAVDDDLRAVAPDAGCCAVIEAETLPR